MPRGPSLEYFFTGLAHVDSSHESWCSHLARWYILFHGFVADFLTLQHRGDVPLLTKLPGRHDAFVLLHPSQITRKADPICGLATLMYEAILQIIELFFARSKVTHHVLVPFPV